MNIFVLDRNPVIAASYHCDRHMKLCLEMAQMLNMNSLYLGGDSFKRDYPPYTNYKISKTHLHHPCTCWLRETLDNSLWGIEYGLAVAKQFEIRYGHEHKAKRAIEWVRDYGMLPKKKGLTPFVVCVRDDLKKIDPVDSYRWCYCFDKARFAKWEKGTDPPPWFRKFEPPIAQEL